jgi:hypothetical protein
MNNDMINISFTRHVKNSNTDLDENYSHSFSHSDDDGIKTFLEKIQVLMEVIGYVTEGRELVLVPRVEIKIEPKINNVHKFSIVHNEDEQ